MDLQYRHMVETAPRNTPIMNAPAWVQDLPLDDDLDELRANEKALRQQEDAEDYGRTLGQVKDRLYNALIEEKADLEDMRKRCEDHDRDLKALVQLETDALREQSNEEERLVVQSAEHARRSADIQADITGARGTVGAGVMANAYNEARDEVAAEISSATLEQLFDEKVRAGLSRTRKNFFVSSLHRTMASKTEDELAELFNKFHLLSEVTGEKDVNGINRAFENGQRVAKDLQESPPQGRRSR